MTTKHEKRTIDAIEDLGIEGYFGHALADQFGAGLRVRRDETRAALGGFLVEVLRVRRGHLQPVVRLERGFEDQCAGPVAAADVSNAAGRGQ